MLGPGEWLIQRVRCLRLGTIGGPLLSAPYQLLSHVQLCQLSQTERVFPFLRGGCSYLSVFSIYLSTYLSRGWGPNSTHVKAMGLGTVASPLIPLRVFRWNNQSPENQLGSYPFPRNKIPMVLMKVCAMEIVHYNTSICAVLLEKK